MKSAKYYQKWLIGLMSLAVLSVGCSSGQIKTGPIKAAEVFDTILPGEILEGEVAHKVPLTKPAPKDKNVHHVRFDITNDAFKVDDEVYMAAWPFGGDLPGPTMRVKEGDKIIFTMANRTESEQSMAIGMPMPHSIDFHSAMVNPEDKYRSIAPGETLRFEYVAHYPGVFMYHCGTPMVLEHLISGMYGAMIVEPKNGYEDKVDHEWVIVQSELYLKKEKGEKYYVSDVEAAKAKRPNYVVFNGKFNRHINEPLKARAGDRIRLFVLNAGPSDTSSFHVIGNIFDKVYLDGNPKNKLVGLQTVLLGASNGAIVEFVLPEPGNYVLVDHEFADATMGAMGMIIAE